MQPIAIACGDHAGVGPEVALEAVAAELPGESLPDVVLIGDAADLARVGSRLRLEPGWATASATGAESCRVRILDPRSEPLPAVRSPGGPVTALAALDYLRRGAEGCLRGEFSALVTAPVSKEAILRAGVAFVGQTEFLGQVAGTPEVTMMLLGDDDRGRWLRVALATTHLPLREVASTLSVRLVEQTIRQAIGACRDLDLPRARVGVAGLNPHAGEGGMLGTEEITVIAPAVAAVRAEGGDVVGPLSGDTVFHQALRGDYDAVVAMYHDQGLAPLKLVAFDRGVNWTLGLPFVRTSPDHGTAFDLAGRGVADPSSMRAALRLAARLAGRREASHRGIS